MVGKKKSVGKATPTMPSLHFKKKRKLEDMGVDEFMKSGLDSSDEEESDRGVGQSEGNTPVLKMCKPQSDSSTKAKTSKHKQSLEKLKEKDPEFYEFLQKEDQELLEFDESDSDMGSSDAEESVHKLPDKLEVASDDSEATTSDEDDVKASSNQKTTAKAEMVTTKFIKQWTAALQNNPTIHAVHTAIQAFKAAVRSTGGDTESSKFHVEGTSMFNAVVQLCLTNLPSAFQVILKVPESKKKAGCPALPSTTKLWSKLRLDIKMYLTDLIVLMSQVAEATIVNVILKHIHKLVTYYASFPKLTKMLLKQLVKVWSSGEETSRVLAFLSINKLTRLLQSKLLKMTLKVMYMEYVKNSKFTSPTSLPMINFMQRSLVEILSMDILLAYEFAFVYIRQLAIHLRNAIITKKKETSQGVYNWQYIHCLGLWTRMLSTIYPSDELQPLIYPLTQTILGTIRLIPTAKFYPLRFHCAKLLNTLSSHTATFIPVLPILLEVFEQTDFNKKHASLSFKPFNFSCILKLSKTQLQEKAFREGLIDQLYEILLEQFHIHSHSVGFPELALPALIQLKDFLKKCKVANFCKQIKQIVDKIEENSKVIRHRRKTSTLDLTDVKAVDAWEIRCKQEGTPIGKYYATWRRLRDHELQYEIAGKDRLVDDIPVIERPPRMANKATEEERKELSALFESSSGESADDDDDDELRFLPKSERPAKKRKTEDDDGSDEYSDFDSDELEQLAGSADEDDENVDEGGNSEDGEEASDSGDSIEDQGDLVEDFVMSDSD